MRILTVPNWSFGQVPALLASFEDALAGFDVDVHFLNGDSDHNRTVSAFSGEVETVEAALMALCDLAFSWIDLRTHQGVHPRIGALDVCPFVTLTPGEESLREALALAERVGSRIGSHYNIPVFLYEKSERGRHEADLLTLRKGGFEGVLQRDLKADYGPNRAHPTLGVTVLGVRDFLIAMNVDLATRDLELGREIAKEMRNYREDGDPRFLGVMARGFPLASRKLTQISMNLTLPDLTPIDPIIDWIETRAAEEGVLVAGTELIGVIREKDLPNATELPVDAKQVVRTVSSI